MKLNISKYFLFIILLCCIISCGKDVEPPQITSVEPIFGPAETLVTFEGTNLGNIREITFSGMPVNFNTAYNSDVALLFRVPNNVPLGEHEVVFVTDGGEARTNFRVTLDPPQIFRFEPAFADVGEVVTIYGKNFFDPLEVFFFDNVPAEIQTFAPDSIEVVVPEGVQKGFITVSANGGDTLSPINFFSVNTIMVNDFDGNGVRSETNKWIFTGFVDQSNSSEAIQSNNPAPIDGQFLKLSGRDNLDISWIGGAENNSADIDQFESFGIQTSPGNTLLRMEINNNGRMETNLLIVLLERNGSINDFTHEVSIDESGWNTIEVPLNRFQDLNGITIDPQKVRTIKLHLIDSNASGQFMEVNVDNLRIVEIL